MQNPFLHPAHGLQLRQASTSGILAVPTSYDIPSGECSETFSLNDCVGCGFDIIAPTADPAGSVRLEKGVDGTFATFTQIDSINTTTRRTWSWWTPSLKSGKHFRIRNSTTQTIRVSMQKRLY